MKATRASASPTAARPSISRLCTWRSAPRVSAHLGLRGTLQGSCAAGINPRLRGERQRRRVWHGRPPAVVPDGDSSRSAARGLVSCCPSWSTERRQTKRGSTWLEEGPRLDVGKGRQSDGGRAPYSPACPTCSGVARRHLVAVPPSSLKTERRCQLQIYSGSITQLSADKVNEAVPRADRPAGRD